MMDVSRRVFIKQGALALASVGLGPACGPYFLRNTVFAAEPDRSSRATGGRKVLICIFQRGAVDGMSMVVPHGDPYYYQHRNVNGIAIPRTGQDGVLDLDGTFGLHPALAPLKPIYQAGHLAPIHACGSPNATRSHFDAQDYMEAGAPGDKSVADGWLTRTLLHCPEDAAKMNSVFRGVAMTSQLPRSLQGEADALAIPDLRTFGINAANAAPVLPRKKNRSMAMGDMQGGHDTSAAGGFEALYDDAVGDVLHGAGKETFEALKMIQSINAKRYMPASGAEYPRTRYGDSLQQIAQLIKADVGLEVAFAEAGGWDTHVNQGSTQGQLARRLQEFGQGLAALYTDLGDRMADVTILTMSEFGRTARQNGNGGTDHGHATCFLALGGNINGGKVLGQWPGLAPEQLYENRDLAVTTDFRDVFGEVAQKHLGVRDLAAVFPHYQSSPDKFRGVLKA
ncbi:MAG: DUF1501 domain-containing protein [Abitibacteriaceae bacterium]|nr:DUF1501 domain-containing protein [Abditibacteriaceae bacterium]MBV9866603.1 DUF1501 domain-containing protein [Abditibacteriaceae bacterium]